MGDPDVSHFRSEAQLQAGLRMWQTFPPVLIVIGTIGNIFSIMVLSRPNIRNSTYSVFLLGLAIADLCLLYIGLLRHWVKYVFDVDVRLTSDVVCKIHLWAVYTNADVCAWILTAITVERLVSTLCPTKRKTLCTVKSAKVIVASILFIFVLVNSHILYGFSLKEETFRNQTTVSCLPTRKEYSVFFEQVWSWVDLCKASVVPFVILSFGNACIIWKVFQSSRRSRSSVTPSNMSKLLVTLNFVFIVCTAPVCIYFIGNSYWIPDDIPTRVQDNDPVWAFVNLLLYINNTINFLLYCVSGSKFRQEFKTMCMEIINKSKNSAVVRTISASF